MAIKGLVLLAAAFVAAPVAIVVAAGEPEREAAVRLAREVVAREAAVAADRIKVTSVAAVQWRDSSLGCPQPGMVYTPSLVSGFRVLLEAGEKPYEVHVAGGRAVVCGEARRPVKDDRADAVKEGLKAAASARKALAGTLRIPAEKIETMWVKPYRASEAECPIDAPAAVAGHFLVQLFYGKRAYVYRATSTVAWPCVTDPK